MGIANGEKNASSCYGSPMADFLCAIAASLNFQQGIMPSESMKSTVEVRLTGNQSNLPIYIYFMMASFHVQLWGQELSPHILCEDKLCT